MEEINLTKSIPVCNKNGGLMRKVYGKLAIQKDSWIHAEFVQDEERGPPKG